MMKDTERKYMIVTIVPALAVTFMMITGLPVGLLIPRQQISDLSEFVIPVGLDHLLCIVTIFAVLGICKTELRPKITREGLSDGIRKTLPVFALILIVCVYSFVKTRELDRT
ncbi:MAG: hypothetical protein IKR73_08350 [Oscillospiraceae bacterium]|nr:hypothetical protein [Oscillospiraceae bacterium]